MKHIDISQFRMTSVSLRASTCDALQRALSSLEVIKQEVSQQRLMRECIRIALRLWRGKGSICERNKRYNQRNGFYKIVPFCTTEALRSVSWARCHHSGISFSRLMDFAIETYLARVVEELLSARFYWRDKADVEYWQTRFARRRRSEPFIISYYSRTHTNNGISLHYEEKSEIKPLRYPESAAA